MTTPVPFGGRPKPLEISAIVRKRMAFIRDEGYNRLGLARFSRGKGMWAQAAYLELEARPMFTALARAILTMRGLTPKHAARTEVRNAVTFIIRGDRK